MKFDKFQTSKGVTPVLAIVLLLGITVASAGTYYATQEALIEDVEDQKTDVLDTFDYQIEQCYMENAKTKLVVRNSEQEESVNASSLSVFVEGAPQEATFSKDIVGPQVPFEITLDTNANRKQVKLAVGEKSETKLCDLEGLTADFVITPANPQINDQIDFDASPATGTITSYKWDVNDDGTYEETGQDITHSYNSAGDKDVTLKVTDNDGDTDTLTKTVTVGGTSTVLTADFDYTPSNPQINNQINFDASPTVGTITSYKWDVNDDGTYEETGQTMTHTYSNPGDKDVTLKVTNNQGTDTITRTVTVTATPTVPVAGKIHEGGDNTSTLEWGTTGDLSIKIKNTAPPPVPNFCIGNQCPENEGNKAPNKGTPRGPYANRDQADINGTIKVENKLKFGSTETLCIGSKCGTNAGDPAYSTQYYNSTHPMDGPVYMNYEESNGLVMADSVCWGSNC